MARAQVTAPPNPDRATENRIRSLRGKATRSVAEREEILNWVVDRLLRDGDNAE